MSQMGLLHLQNNETIALDISTSKVQIKIMIRLFERSVLNLKNREYFKCEKLGAGRRILMTALVLIWLVHS